MEQETIRKEIILLHETRGIPYTFMARKLNISNSFISLWIRDERNFSNRNLEKAKKYLEEERNRYYE